MNRDNLFVALVVYGNSILHPNNLSKEYSLLINLVESTPLCYHDFFGVLSLLILLLS